MKNILLIIQMPGALMNWFGSVGPFKSSDGNFERKRVSKRYFLAKSIRSLISF
jgi:hypothetical protein